MAKVVIPRALASLVGGTPELEIDAPDIEALLTTLDARYPGLAQTVRDQMAVAVDGEILNDPFREPLGRDSEVHFLPRIQGG